MMENITREIKLRDEKNYSSDIENMMLESAWNEYHLCFEDKRELENKSNLFLVASGVLLGLVLNGFNQLDLKIALIGCVFIIISSICCIFSMRLHIYYEVKTANIWSSLERNKIDMYPNRSKHAFFQSIASKNEKNYKNNEKITFWLNIAIYMFTFGFIILFFSLIIFQLSNIHI